MELIVMGYWESPDLNTIGWGQINGGIYLAAYLRCNRMSIKHEDLI